jgi:hypothetical protein
MKAATAVLPYRRNRENATANTRGVALVQVRREATGIGIAIAIGRVSYLMTESTTTRRYEHLDP